MDGFWANRLGQIQREIASNTSLAEGITVTKGTTLDINRNSDRTMPRELWPWPVAECQQIAPPPPFPSNPELMRQIAPVITYLSVALSYADHATGGRWLSSHAFCTLAGFGISLVRWPYR